MRTHTVAVAHREALVAEGLAAGLASYPGIAVVGVATTGADAANQGRWAEAMALDAGLPGAPAVAARLRRQGVRVILVEPTLNGAGGNGDGEDGVRVPTHARMADLAAALVPGAARRPLPLSGQQRRVLALVARGLTARQVARHLGISPKTVEQHKARIFEKLGVPNQTAAVRVAAALGLEDGQP